jgi:hypothetical protein
VSPAGPQDSFFRGGRGAPLPFRANTHQRRCWSHRGAFRAVRAGAAGTKAFDGMDFLSRSGAVCRFSNPD